MEGLQPHSNVESLFIEGYSGVGLPNWFSTSLSNLTEITIESCHSVQHLPHLPTLQCLYLSNMRSLKFIHKNNEPCCFLSFPSLIGIYLKNMPNLEGWWASRVEGETLPIFPQLQYLRLQRCPKLSSMPKIASTRQVTVILRDVSVQVVSAIIGPLLNFHEIRLEEIKDLKDLEMEFHQNQNPNLGSSSSSMSSQSLTRLRVLKIEKCSNLMSLPEWIGTITSLWDLKIIDCPKLKSLPEGMRQLKSLNWLTIKGCPQLQERCKEGGEDWPNIAHILFKRFTEIGAVETAEIAEIGIWRKIKDFIPNVRSSLTCGRIA